jgi:hypothetical protein
VRYLGPHLRRHRRKPGVNLEPFVNYSGLIDKEKERLALLRVASRIVTAESAKGRVLTKTEDSLVLALMNRVRILEEEISHLKRHPVDL